MPRPFREQASLKRVRELLDYNPESGKIYWKRRQGGKQGGTEAGYTDPEGYRHIRVDGTLYLAHRLAWFHHHGAWPLEFLDHANLVSSDNRLANLREATKGQNEHNTRRRRNNTSGYKGVVFLRKENRWWARIMRNRETFDLGRYASAEAAAAAYAVAAQNLHGQFARTT